MSKSKAVVSSMQNNQADQLNRSDYQALETALLQTARGRNFLAEYLRRNGRDAVPASHLMVEEEGEETSVIPPRAGVDTDRILQAVEKLHNAVMERQRNPGADHLRMDILEMAKAIAKTRSEINAMRTDGDYDHLTVASEEMDAIVQSTEKATNDILQAAEKIQEVAWRLREAGIDEAECEEIDNNATDIYMACSFQDLTGQRTTKVVRVLQYLEARINSMIEIWGLADEDKASLATPEADHEVTPVDERPDAHLLNGPQMQEAALGQDNIDALLGDDAFASIPDMPDPASDTDDRAGVQTSSDEIIDEEQLKALFA